MTANDAPGRCAFNFHAATRPLGICRRCWPLPVARRPNARCCPPPGTRATSSGRCRPGPTSRSRAGLWTGPEGVEALAWFESDGEVWIETLAGREALVAEAVAWVERAWRKQLARENRDAATPVQIRAMSHDARRIAALEALGYRKAGPGGVGFRRRLDDPLPPPTLPPGYALRDCVGVDPELRAAAHRAAWDHLEHLGLDAHSQFSTERYLSLTRLPVYDPTLDMLAVAPDGSFAASCTCWADRASGIATFEPVGVALAHRGRRLAGAIMREAVVRLKARGLREARVGTAHFNLAAIQAYLAAGFEPAGASHWWAKTLA